MFLTFDCFVIYWTLLRFGDGVLKIYRWPQAKKIIMKEIEIFLTFYNIPDTERDEAEYFYAGILATQDAIQAVDGVHGVDIASPVWLPRFGKQLEITSEAITNTLNAWYDSDWDDNTEDKHVIWCLHDFFTALGYYANVKVVYDVRECPACSSEFYTFTENSKQKFCKPACRKYFNKYGKRQRNKKCFICGAEHNRQKFCSNACKQANWRNEQLKKNYLLAKCPICKFGNLRTYGNKLLAICSGVSWCTKKYNNGYGDLDQQTWDAIKFMSLYGAGFDDSTVTVGLDNQLRQELSILGYHY